MSLPTPSYTPVAPPADGLQLAFRAARRRRQGKATAAGGAGLLAAVALVLSLGGASGNQTLLQEELPPAHIRLPQPVGPGAASPAPTQADRVASIADQAAATRRSGSTSVTAPLAAGGAATPAAAGRAPTAAGAAPVKQAPVSGPMTRTQLPGIPSDVVCPVRNRSDGSLSLCTRVTVSSGDGNNVEATLCSTEANAVSLSYASEKELDIVVRDSNRDDVWRWSVGHRFLDHRHTLLLDSGNCLYWTTDWREVDQQGRALRPGTYTVRAEFAAPELSVNDRVASTTYTVSAPSPAPEPRSQRALRLL